MEKFSWLMASCIFCKIVKEEIPCYKVYEDKDNLAFLDIQPCAQGHTVVISKTHAATIAELDNDKLQSLILAVKKATAKITGKMHPAGFTIGINHGEISGQTVPHLHIHIFPRYPGDGGGSVHSVIKNPGARPVDEIAKLFK